jgi:hypothetical protein
MHQNKVFGDSQSNSRFETASAGQPVEERWNGEEWKLIGNVETGNSNQS